MTGFEPAASSSRTKRATWLRYIPLRVIMLFFAPLFCCCLPGFHALFFEIKSSIGYTYRFTCVWIFRCEIKSTGINVIYGVAMGYC